MGGSQPVTTSRRSEPRTSTAQATGCCGQPKGVAGSPRGSQAFLRWGVRGLSSWMPECPLGQQAPLSRPRFVHCWPSAWGRAALGKVRDRKSLAQTPLPLSTLCGPVRGLRSGGSCPLRGDLGSDWQPVLVCSAGPLRVARRGVGSKAIGHTRQVPPRSPAQCGTLRTGLLGGPTQAMAGTGHRSYLGAQGLLPGCPGPRRWLQRADNEARTGRYPTAIL